MITRLWHGWTSFTNADAYEELLTNDILPEFFSVQGFQGAHVLRRDLEDEVEFLVITHFVSLDAVKAFAGETYATAVVPAEAQKLLKRYDSTAVHYDAVKTLIQPPAA